DHDDLGLRRLEHLFPATEDVLDAVAVGDRLGARLVALAEGDDTAAVDLERGDVGAAEAEADDADRGRVLGDGISAGGGWGRSSFRVPDCSVDTGRAGCSSRAARASPSACGGGRAGAGCAADERRSGPWRR